MERIATSPRLKARIGGFFWLMTALAGTLSLMAGGRTVGLVANTVATLCYAAATLVVYGLLKPVNRNLSLLAASSSLLGCANGLAIMFLGLPTRVGIISTACFGIHCFLVGYLIFRSTFLPRIVGALMMLAGVGWLSLSFSKLLMPLLGRSLSPYLMGAGIFGEVSLTLWLLVMGVNEQRWKEQAEAAARARVNRSPMPA